MFRRRPVAVRKAKEVKSWIGTTVEIAELDELWLDHIGSLKQYPVDYQVMRSSSWFRAAKILASRIGVNVSSSEAQKFFEAGCRQLPSGLLKEEFVSLVIFFIGEFNTAVTFGSSVIRFGLPPEDFLENEELEQEDPVKIFPSISSASHAASSSPLDFFEFN